MKRRRGLMLAGFLTAWMVAALAAVDVVLPLREDAVRFAVIGDSGTGERAQYEVAEQLAEYHQRAPFQFVIMMGDNMYGGESPRDFERKFERPYKALLDAGIKFYAALGNHDQTAQSNYIRFNMDGKRYYSFKPRDGVRFFALDSNYMDREQLTWLESELRKSGSEWKIAFFHHPIYSSGARHGANEELRRVLEPLFLKYGVDVVFAGHEHFYERIHPQHGIYYFISGAAGKLREGNIRKSDITASGYDSDRHFMAVEIDKDDMYFQAVSRRGRTVDAGVIHRREKAQTAIADR